LRRRACANSFCSASDHADPFESESLSKSAIVSTVRRKRSRYRSARFTSSSTRASKPPIASSPVSESSTARSRREPMRRAFSIASVT